VTANIVEGCARRTLRDYLHFVGIALGSASEVRYLVGLSQRLVFLDEKIATDLTSDYSELIRGVQTLISSLSSET
jgi:four helix bundle protein